MTWMKSFLVAVAVLLGVCPPPARAEDLTVQLKLEYGTTLKFEPVHAFVTIQNNADEPFVLDSNASRKDAGLEFSIRAKGIEESQPRSDRQPLVKTLKVDPDQKQDLMIDISMFYDLSDVGQRMVSVCVSWKGKDYWSNLVVLDVVEGIEIASVARGMPGDPERVRNYSLRYWARDKREYLFLCVYEGDPKANMTSYGVFQVGSLVRTVKPTLEIDRIGNIKIMQLMARDCFLHSYFKSLSNEVQFIGNSYKNAEGDPYGLESQKDESAPFELPSKDEPKKKSWFSRLYTRTPSPPKSK